MSNDAVAMLLLNAAGHVTGEGFRAWYGYTYARHMLEWERYQARGYRFVSLSLHGSIDNPRYSAVMIDPRVLVANELPVEQLHWPYLTTAEMQHVFDEQAQQRFGPVLLSATGTARDPRFAAVFEPHDVTLTRLALSSGPDDRPGTFQYMNAVARDRGLILRSVTAYGAWPGARLAAIWRQNTTSVEWSAATVLVSSSEHQERFNAYRSGWCRPALVTPNDDLRYTSLYVGDNVGPWVLKRGMTSASLQAELNRRVNEGYLPTSVQAAGMAAGTRYTALFAKRIEPAPNQFTPTGPVANEEIDDIVLRAMRRWSIRNAAVAIVRRDRLVYARGYTWGHLGWPLTQPTTLFRLASVSKVLTALGIHQLTEAESDLRNSTVMSILNLSDPRDPDFRTITVDHLLEHTSGVAHQLHWHDVRASGNSPPASPEMTDAYIAEQMLEFSPGTRQAYSGAAYYLLGRVLATKRQRASVFDALRVFLFRPLQIARVRPSPVDISTLPHDEGRCRAPSLGLARSVMQQSRPLVPVGYGNANLPKGAATGGMSMAAVDLGRILAFMLSDPEAPMSGDTIRGMRLAAVETQEEWTHAGHGWDVAPRATYILRKGGWLRTSRSTAGINSDFGLAMLWGGALNDAGDPVYDTVMDIVTHTGWPQDRDLFPYFDMSPLHQIVRR